jgi:hypothetical protein
MCACGGVGCFICMCVCIYLHVYVCVCVYTYKYVYIHKTYIRPYTAARVPHVIRTIHAQTQIHRHQYVPVPVDKEEQSLDSRTMPTHTCTKKKHHNPVYQVHLRCLAHTHTHTHTYTKAYLFQTIKQSSHSIHAQCPSPWAPPHASHFHSTLPLQYLPMAHARYRAPGSCS